MCKHEHISQATSSDWESVCADCGEVMKIKQTWKRQPYSDRHKLVNGEWEIVAVGVGHDETRSYYILKRGGKVIDDFEKICDAKAAVEWAL